jgi:hypothetical protein
MGLAFYRGCEPHLDRRRFLKLVLAAGAAPVLVPNLIEDRDFDEGARRLIKRHGTTPDDPWMLVHGVRALGKTFRLEGEGAVAYVLHTFVRELEVNGRRYLHIPADAEVHTNMFLKTFLEAGVPLAEEVQVKGRIFHLKDLGEGAKALFRFDPNTFDRNDLAWSLISFAELQADVWENVYGQRIQLREVAAFGLKVLQEATDGIKPYLRASLPLPQKMPIHSFTCGGTHLIYSILVAARHGLLDAQGLDSLQGQLQMLLYRLQADPDLMDRHYQRVGEVPGVEMFRASAKLKLLGHALECLGYAKASGLFRPGQAEWERIAQARREVRGFSTYFEGLDLQAVRRRETPLYRQIIGDTCHAFRGLHLL